MSGQDFASAGQTDERTDGRTDGRHALKHNTIEGPFGCIISYQTVININTLYFI